MTSLIPKLLHQTFSSKTLSPVLQDITGKLIAQNPGWTYRLYDDDDVKQFIRDVYGQSVLSAFLTISPQYGAARADLFRYLLMYELGGVYLDIKSAILSSLDAVLTLDEGFVLSKWPNGPGTEFAKAGLHPELAAFPRGEFQQWHIICAPKHPFLAAVVERVLKNIASYTPWAAGVGRTGVLRTTGPIPYTLAIEPIKTLHKHVEVHSHMDIGLRYYAIGDADHRPLFKQHYSQLDTPVVSAKGLGRVVTSAYISARRAKHRLFRRNVPL